MSANLCLPKHPLIRKLNENVWLLNISNSIGCNSENLKYCKMNYRLATLRQQFHFLRSLLKTKVAGKAASSRTSHLKNIGQFSSFCSNPLDLKLPRS